MGGWSSWSFGSFGTAAGFLSWDVWWPVTGSTGLAILLSARSCRKLSLEWWLCPLHLLWPVPLGCRQLRLTFLSSMILLQRPLLYEWWDCRPLCLSVHYWWISIGLVLIQLILSIGSVSLVLLRGIFWTILDSTSFPFFHGAQVFHELVCPLTIVLPWIFFWSLPPLTILCWRTLLVITKHPEDEPGIAQVDNTTTRLLHSNEEVPPIRIEHCQNTKFPRSRYWKWPRLAYDDLPPSSEKNQQAKKHKTQVWPRKAERYQCVGNLPSHDRREVCTSHHHG